MKEKAKKKTISLNKMLRIGFGALYLIAILLLLLLDVFVIASYEHNIQNGWKDAVSKYADSLSSNRSNLSAYMQELYSYDANFTALSNATGLESLAEVYALNDKLKANANSSALSDGYIIYFNDPEQTNYYLPEDTVPTIDKEEFKETIATMKNMQENRGSWYYQTIAGHNYAICIYKKNLATIVEFFSLDSRLEDLPEAVGNGKTKAFYIYDGRALGDGDQEDLQSYEELAQGSSFSGIHGRYYVCGYQIGKTGLWACAAIPLSFSSFVNLQAILLVLLTLAAIFGAFYLNRRLTAQLFVPLYSLTNQMAMMSYGDLGHVMETDSELEELQQITATLNDMLERLREQEALARLKDEEAHRQEELAHAEAMERQKAQMQYLSMQLKPHFYLNGLKALNAVAMNGDTEKIQEIILRLSEHLRGKLSVEQELVPLESEVEYTKNYVELQMDITDRKISIDWDIPENAKDWYVPNLCIQTFVENSVKYAKLGNVQAELHLTIFAHELETDDGKYLDLYVRDNGAGYPEDVLAIINGEPTEGGKCIGINNLKRRCRLIYGDWMEYVFGNDEGAMSNLILPWKRL